MQDFCGETWERERLLGIATRRWDDIIKMGLQEMGRYCLD